MSLTAQRLSLYRKQDSGKQKSHICKAQGCPGQTTCPSFPSAACSSPHSLPPPRPTVGLAPFSSLGPKHSQLTLDLHASLLPSQKSRVFLKGSSGCPSVELPSQHEKTSRASSLEPSASLGGRKGNFVLLQFLPCEYPPGMPGVPGIPGSPAIQIEKPCVCLLLQEAPLLSSVPLVGGSTNIPCLQPCSQRYHIAFGKAS